MKERIIELRDVIRYHRDQKGDERCWLDDFIVWKTISGKDITELPTYEEGMKRCRAYFTLRSAESFDETVADVIYDKARWDEDLTMIGEDGLRYELANLENAIKKHRDISGCERTVDDDRELYAVLPEKLPADFRLPREEDFLGTTKTNAGCPQFWESHHTCLGKHNLHQWGPCQNGSC